MPFRHLHPRTWAMLRAMLLSAASTLFLCVAIAEAATRADMAIMALGFAGMALSAVLRILERQNGQPKDFPPEPPPPAPRDPPTRGDGG